MSDIPITTVAQSTKNKSKFSLPAFMTSGETPRIIVEVVVVLGICYYFNSKASGVATNIRVLTSTVDDQIIVINNLKKSIDPLNTRIAKLEAYILKTSKQSFSRHQPIDQPHVVNESFQPVQPPVIRVQQPQSPVLHVKSPVLHVQRPPSPQPLKFEDTTTPTLDDLLKDELNELNEL